jgi:adenosylmethionine-8-amino-7-oxononanoate aminotransferase
MAKGMTSGYYPLGAVIARNRIVEEVVGKGGFLHGFTYAGNPMACAVGLEVFDIIVENDLPGNAAVVGAQLKAGLEALAERHPIIGQVRGRGLLLAIELVQDRATRRPFAAEHQVGLLFTDIAFERGVIIYPRRPIHGLAGDHVLIAPPLTVTAAESDEILNRLDQALVKLESAVSNF